ncbi:MAG TPA: low-complexity protein [Cyanobacteria bacterium UBA8803]|nr:low-complexity protein [Cyanobacteria bacterium UBA9273]HBL62721.1 low-complexity protein [Cyanobacteria bacterium UBA8803]
MQIQNFLDRYRQGERNFTQVDLSGASLRGADLRNINLSGANLTSANLSWASLDRANLAGAILHQADLHNAILNNSNLDRANLSRANLRKVDLRLATLRSANLTWADASNADLSEADLSNAQLDRINLTQAQLNNTLLIGAQLMEANLCYTNLMGANLSTANLREARLEVADLGGAILVGANLTEANIQGAYLRAANLSEADLHRAILTNADMSEANCDRAHFSRANLTGAYSIKTNFARADLQRAVLQNVYLLRTDLSDANLRGADLRRADLSGAYLKNAILSEANLTDAHFLESYLIGTQLDKTELTGCCIHNWHLENVDLSQVNCRYVFTGFNHTTQSPCDRYPVSGNLPFGKLGQANLTACLTIDVQFVEVPNWEALVFTLARLEREYPDLQLTIQGYERRVGQYLLKLSANSSVNPQLLRERILQLYSQISQNFTAQRQAILKVLQIERSSDSRSPSLLQLINLPSLPLISADHQQQIYRQVVYQIQQIIMSQPPEKFLVSVQRLLKFLKQHNISTEEIQQDIIGSAILKRAEKDAMFQKQLLQWEKSADRIARFSTVGQAMCSAISLILSEAQSSLEKG